MSITDPFADVLTKIRNASRAKHATVEVPASRLTEQFLGILKAEGFIKNFKTTGQAPQRTLRIYLKYGQDRQSVITALVRVSKPGMRVYRGVEDLPRVLSGYGRAILTTSRGLLTDQDARRQRVGGEILCKVW